jgi:HK97 family phage prohead protease
MKRYAENHKFYAEFTKVDPDERIVSGYASTEALDSQNEIVTRSAMEAALPDWLKFGNIREMHQPSAVGVAMKAHFDDKGLLIEAHIVDDSAWKKVKAGVYKGFSIGGNVKGRDKANKSIITQLNLTEISIVDRPANPEALFDVWKLADGNATTEATEGDANPKEKPDEAAKGMFGVGRLAGILQEIQNAAQDAEWEAEFERDGSNMPDALKTWLKTGGQLLVQMATEETAEMTEDETTDVEVIALANAAADLAKGGKRNSKADQKKLNDAHDAIVSAGADCGSSMKGDNTGDLTKAAEELSMIKGDLSRAHDDLAKAATDLAEALVKVTEGQDTLAAMTKSRDETTASLIALGKSLETTSAERDDFAKRNETLDADLAAMTATADALKAEVEKLKAAPEPMKGKLLAVAKGDDIAADDRAALVTASPAPAVQQERWFSARPQ